MSEQEKNLRWYNLAMMAFVAVWGFGNVVNNFHGKYLLCFSVQHISL